VTNLYNLIIKILCYEKITSFIVIALIAFSCTKSDEDVQPVASKTTISENRVDITPTNGKKDKHPIPKAKLTIEFETGLTALSGSDCFEAWDICISITFEPSVSSTSIDKSNQTVTLELDKNVDPTFFTNKVSSGQYEFVDDQHFPTEIESQWFTNGTEIYIEEGFYDFTTNGDIITITAPYIEI
jgi:hypothetical protein